MGVRRDNNLTNLVDLFLGDSGNLPAARTVLSQGSQKNITLGLRSKVKRRI